MPPAINGGQLLTKTASKAGIEVCFANPGTTELPMVLALDSEPGIRAILGLFEGVCTGAADGYGRMLDKPAMTLLHLGPGLANGIANLHNARKAKTPLVNVIGQHTTWHLAADAPLAMDIEALAGTVSGWQRTSKSPATLSQDLAEAVAASRYGQVATLIVPNDYQLAECSVTEVATPQFSFDPVDLRAIEEAARAMRTSDKTGLIIGGRALREPGLHAAAHIQAVTGCDVLTDTYPSYLERGIGLPDVKRIPHFPESGIEMVSRYQTVILAGTKEPVTFFGYPGTRSYLLAEDQKRWHIATARQDAAQALECLAEALGASPGAAIPKGVLPQPSRPHIPRGELTAEKACLTLAALQPEGAIIVDEGITAAATYYPLTAGLPKHAFLAVSGGSIGYGMPCAVGAAVACPDRPVINLQADGSAMYTVQALWTQAREALDVTTLICSNRSYEILKIELARAGVTVMGPKALSLVELNRPDINWVRIAEGMGVPGVTVRTAEELARELPRALSSPGPHLIEMVLV
jgi:acetolactate synthase-1/2/3 large subunit